MVAEIQLLLYHVANKEIHIDLCWVPGHSVIVGNENADSSAKSATRVDRQASTRAIPHTDMTEIIKVAVIKEWQRYWLSPERLRIGHTNLTHFYLMEIGTNPPMCNRCNMHITVKHILVECPKFQLAIRKYYNNPSLVNMLKETDKFSTNKIMCLQDIYLTNQI